MKLILDFKIYICIIFFIRDFSAKTWKFSQQTQFPLKISAAQILSYCEKKAFPIIEFSYLCQPILNFRKQRSSTKNT